MSRVTIARRYNVGGYTDSERQQLIGHILNKTQPQRRIFLGKTEGFTDKEDQKYNAKMLAAYIKGHVLFYHGTVPKEIIRFKFNKETGKKDLPVKTGIFEDVPKAHLVRQMYFYN